MPERVTRLVMVTPFESSIADLEPEPLPPSSVQATTPPRPGATAIAEGGGHHGVRRARRRHSRPVGAGHDATPPASTSAESQADVASAPPAPLTASEPLPDELAPMPATDDSRCRRTSRPR